MRRFDVILDQARSASNKELNSLGAEQFATGYLAEWVCRLEAEIEILERESSAIIDFLNKIRAILGGSFK